MATLSSLGAAGAGFSSMLALVSVPGAQNALFLEQAGKPGRAIRCAVIFCLADLLLIMGGAALLAGSKIFSSKAFLFPGVVILSHLGLSAIGSIIGPDGGADENDLESQSRCKFISRALGVTFLNPLVYIDTIGVIGGGLPRSMPGSGS